MTSCGAICISNAFAIAAHFLLFVFVTVLIVITTLKYKNYGFTLKLMILLDLGVASFTVFYALVLSIIAKDDTENSS